MICQVAISTAASSSMCACTSKTVLHGICDHSVIQRLGDSCGKGTSKNLPCKAFTTQAGREFICNLLNWLPFLPLSILVAEYETLSMQQLSHSNNWIIANPLNCLNCFLQTNRAKARRLSAANRTTHPTPKPKFPQ
jgi:hypothetical protein